MSTGDTQSLFRRAISTEADTNASITGINVMAESSDTMKALQVDASGYLKVSLEVDSVGIGGGTQYAIDTGSGATDTGTLSLVIRDDTLTTLTPIDGDYVGLRVNSTGALHVTGGGGGTEYTEDVATANPIVGSATLMERDDVLSAVTPAEADWIGLRGTAEGALWTQDFNSDAILADTTAILADTAAMDTNLATLAGAVAGTEIQVDIVSGASSGTEYTEDAVKSGNTSGVAGMMVRDDVLGGVTPIAGDWIPQFGTAEGALWTQDFNSDAILAGQLPDGHNVTVDNASIAVTGTFFQATQPVSGTVTANLSAVDNAVLDTIDAVLDTIKTDSAAMVVDLAAIEVTQNTLAGAVTGTEMQVDVITMPSTAVTNAGTFATQATLQAGSAAIGKLAANSGVDIGDVDVVALTGSTIAHDGADSGNPHKIGGKAKAFDSTAPGTNVAEDDRVDAIFSLEGRQYVNTIHPNFWSVSVDYGAAQTNATVKAAAGAGLKLYVTGIYCSNGATAGNITVLDGSGGTVLWETYPAINGGGVLPSGMVLPLTANTLLAITSTTVTTHTLTVQGFIAA